MTKTHSVCMIIAVLLASAGPLLAQTTPAVPQHVPLQKTIGQPGPDIVPSLIVINARGASLQGDKLTLTGVAPNSIVFADRPVRAAGHALTTHLLEEWSPSNESDESFTKDPPNGTISVFNTDGSKIRDAVVVLKTAKLDGDKLTFDVDVLEGELAGGDGPAALFIDRFGFGGFHAGGFHAGGRAVPRWRLPRRLRSWGMSASVGSAPSAIIPTSREAPGIAGLDAPVAPQRSAGQRWVRRRQVPPIPTAAITPIRLATEATRTMRALLDRWPNRARRSAEPGPTGWRIGRARSEMRVSRAVRDARRHSGNCYAGISATAAEAYYPHHHGRRYRIPEYQRL